MDAFKKLSRDFDLAAAYVPGVAEMTSDWREELTEAFTEVVVHGDDAVEVLEREALRK